MGRAGLAGEGKGCSQILVQASQAGRAEDLLGKQPADDGREGGLLAQCAAASRDSHFAFPNCVSV